MKNVNESLTDILNHQPLESDPSTSTTITQIASSSVKSIAGTTGSTDTKTTTLISPNIITPDLDVSTRGRIKKIGILGHKIYPLDVNLDSLWSNPNTKGAVKEEKVVVKSTDYIENTVVKSLDFNESDWYLDERSKYDTNSEAYDDFTSASLTRLGEKIRNLNRGDCGTIESLSATIAKAQQQQSISTPTKIIYQLSKMHKQPPVKSTKQNEPTATKSSKKKNDNSDSEDYVPMKTATLVDFASSFSSFI